MSTHAQVLGLRRGRSHLAISGALDAGLLPDTTGSAQGSGAPVQLENRELNGWPALPFARMLKTVRSPGPPLR